LGLADLFDAAGPGLREFGQGIGDLLSALTPLLEPLGLLAGTILGVIGEAFAAISPGLQMFTEELGTVLTPIIEKLSPILNSLAEIVGTLLSAAFEALTPLLAPIGKLFEIVLDAIQPMLPILEQMADEIGKALVDAGSELTPVFTDLASVFSEMMKILGPLAVLILRLAAEILPPLLDIIVGIIKVAAELTSGILRLAAGVLRAVNQFLRWLKNLPQVQSAIRSSSDAVKTFVGWIRSLVDWAGKAWKTLKDLGSAAADIGKGLLNKIPGVHLAAGAVVYGPQKALIGEAGPEVVIPLTRPKRAAELVARSGLLDVVARATGGVGAAHARGQMRARDVAVHIHTQATNSDILVRKMQRAMAAALT